MSHLEPQPSPAADPDAASTRFVGELMAHRHRIFAFIMKHVGNVADAEDLFQKTSIVLWKKMDRYDPSGSFFRWAAGVSQHEIFNFRRTRRRDRHCFSDDVLEMIGAEAMQEHDRSDSRLGALRSCVATLPEDGRRVLQACYEPQATITNVAEIMGRTRASLYKQLARLRRRLLTCIRQRLQQDIF